MLVFLQFRKCEGETDFFCQWEDNTFCRQCGFPARKKEGLLHVMCEHSCNSLFHLAGGNF